MKKINVLFIALESAGLLQACTSHKTASSSDSAATKTDISAVTTVKTDSSAVVMADTTFAAKAAVGGMAEVALGKMVSGKGDDSKVKDFGKMTVMDHGKANNELMGIAKAKNIILPDWMPSTRPRVTA